MLNMFWWDSSIPEGKAVITVSCFALTHQSHHPSCKTLLISALILNHVLCLNCKALKSTLSRLQSEMCCPVSLAWTPRRAAALFSWQNINGTTDCTESNFPCKWLVLIGGSCACVARGTFARFTDHGRLCVKTESNLI